MPKFEITDPTSGRTVEIDGPSMPSEAVLRQIFAKLPPMEAKPAAESSPAEEPSSKGALVMQGAAKSAPVAANMAMEVATNPNIPKAVGSAARTGVTLGTMAHGAATGNLAEVLVAPQAGWRAGSGGYRIGQLAQKAAAPIAKAASAVAPYAQALSTVSGAQGVGDLAQMVDPERQDIGVLGVGGKADILNNENAVKRLVNASPSIGDAIANLKQLGMSQAEAVKTVLDIKWLSRRLERK